MDNNFYYKFIKPDKLLADFVESIGMFYYSSNEAKEVVIIPDGKIDLFFLQSESGSFQVTLTGLETAPKQRIIPPKTFFFDINFKPLALEYILHTTVADVLNSAKDLPDDFWNFSAEDLKILMCFIQKHRKK